MSEEKNQVEIEDEPIVVEDVELSTDGMSIEEIELGREHGVIPKEEEPKDGEHEEQHDVETEDNEDDEDKGEEKEEEINTDPDNFEEIDKVYENNQKKFHEKYTPNQKALYFKNKANKQKAQQIKKEFEEFKAKVKESGADSVYQKQIDKIRKLLTEDTDNLTIESLNSIINEKVEIVKEPETNNNLKEVISNKVKFAEEIGNAKYNNFKEIAGLADELYNSNNSYKKVIDSAFTDEDVDADMLVETIVSIARLSPKYEKITNEVKPEQKDKIDRVLKNSKKKISSASVSSSGTKRVISENELTCDQAARLPLSQWEKLSDKTKRRIQMGIDPD